MITIRDAQQQDIAAITAIFNDAVLHSNAIWMETPVDEKNRALWWNDRTHQGFPVLVADENGQCLGYATYGPYRPYEGFRFSAEISIYLDSAARGKGIGLLLMEELIERAREQGLHVLLGGIEAGNQASLALHKKCGFVETARMPQVGFKKGQWLDLVFMQKNLD